MMRFTSVLLTIVSSASVAWGQANPPASIPVTDYDAIIVGGGPSGLSALSGLARVRRNVLLIDSGVYRNGATRHMHDVIGFDGVTPAYYRWAARRQLAHYSTVDMMNGTVTNIQPESNNTYFTVAADLGGVAGEQTFTARKVVLGTGLRDILPNTPGIRENWGQGIYWCPWCDGHEHADQALGLLANMSEVASLVREVSTLNSNVAAFVNGTDTEQQRAAADLSFPDWETYLEINNVKIYNGTIAQIDRLLNGTTGDEDPSLPSFPEHDLFEVTFQNGDEPVLRNAFLSSWPSVQASDVGQEAGVALYGGRLAADPSAGLSTNIPGIYAIGDANSDNVTNVPHALFSGKRTAVYLHVRLAREEALVEIADAKAMSKRSDHEEARSVWDQMNGEPGDALYAGRFDQ